MVRSVPEARAALISWQLIVPFKEETFYKYEPNVGELILLVIML